jgi:hypothetical protein
MPVIASGERRFRGFHPSGNFFDRASLSICQCSRSGGAHSSRLVGFDADPPVLEFESVLRGLLKWSAKELFATFVFLIVVLDTASAGRLGCFIGRSFNKDFNGVLYSLEGVSWCWEGFWGARSAAMASTASGENSTKALSVSGLLCKCPSGHLDDSEADFTSVNPLIDPLLSEKGAVAYARRERYRSLALVAGFQLRINNGEEGLNVLDAERSTWAILLTKSPKVSTVQRQSIAVARNGFRRSEGSRGEKSCSPGQRLVSFPRSLSVAAAGEARRAFVLLSEASWPAVQLQTQNMFALHVPKSKGSTLRVYFAVRMSDS